MESKHHYILPTKTACAVGGTLIFLTGVTVYVAGIDLGKLNFFIAFVVATIKATLVALIFMNLKNDHKENAVIFATSFLFLSIFIILTLSDLFFRGDVYVKGPLVMELPSSASQIKKAWISTPALLTKGKELFSVQCIACHGEHGKGDGPAASALKPPPRNFILSEGWKNGRKPSQVFKTLKEGISGSAMSSFATLPPDDRWALSHYVLSLGAAPQVDGTADLAKIGIDPSKDTARAETEQSIPVELAIKRMAEEAIRIDK